MAEAGQPIPPKAMTDGVFHKSSPLASRVGVDSRETGGFLGSAAGPYPASHNGPLGGIEQLPNDIPFTVALEIALAEDLVLRENAEHLRVCPGTPFSNRVFPH